MPDQWREEKGPHGARRWVNLRTGHIQYRKPGSPHPRYVQAQAKIKEGWEKFHAKSKQGGLTLPDEAVEKPKPKGKGKKDHFEDQAVQEWHDNGRPMPEGYEPDTSFDFGTSETKEEPHPFKRTPEEEKADWEKFLRKMEHEAKRDSSKE